MLVTRTINRIHFEDLAPDRFEDLCLAIIYRYTEWDKIQHFGRTGHDDGIDIFCEDTLEDEIKRKWYIQCKRYKSINKSNLEEIINAINGNEIPNIFFLIVSCDISKSSIEFFQKKCFEKGIEKVLIWTASVIEAELYSKHHDLLFAYFNINLNERQRTKVATVKRNIALKKRMIKDFIGSIDTSKQDWKIYDKFIHSEAIIRSIDDSLYPENELNEFGISPWFKVEYYDFYHNGLEVITGIDMIQINHSGEWFLSKYKQEIKEGFNECKVFRNKRIPYNAIIDYDLDGDEYYNFPHIFCDFKYNGTPFEGATYRIISDEKSEHICFPLDNENMIKEK